MIKKPNGLFMPSDIIDCIPKMSGSAIKIVVAIWKATFTIGAHDVRLTNMDLAELCNLSINSVIDGITEAIELGLISRAERGGGYIYCLAFEDSQPKEKKSPRPKRELTPHQEMISALAKVMKISARLNAGRLGKFASALVSEKYTPEQIIRFYGDGGIYWKTDWRGIKMQPPNERSIGETIKQYIGERKEFIQSTDGGFYV